MRASISKSDKIQKGPEFCLKANGFKLSSIFLDFSVKRSRVTWHLGILAAHILDLSPQLFFQGTKERQWNMSGPVRYIRIVGGPPTRETLLIGLKTGQVYSPTFHFLLSSLLHIRIVNVVCIVAKTLLTGEGSHVFKGNLPNCKRSPVGRFSTKKIWRYMDWKIYLLRYLGFLCYRLGLWGAYFRKKLCYSPHYFEVKS